MSESKKNAAIYILCNPVYATGGTELAHQAAHKLREMGYNAKMLYMHTNKDPVNQRFKSYQVPWTFELDDRVGVTVILPESCLGYVKKIKLAQVCAWWMSVDNFLSYASLPDLIRNKRWNRISASLKRTFREKTGFREKDSYANRQLNLKSDSKRFSLHLYQSEYAKRFLKSYGIKHVAKLSDYINDYYVGLDLNKCKARENIILYNPSKGFRVTSLVMRELDGFNFVPLEGLSVSEMRDRFARAKVYVDFGNHPGKDRIPREAAASGCVVITNRQGAASYFEDLPIADEFKISDGPSFIQKAASAIRKNISEYEVQLIKQDNYREFIINEKCVFADDLKSVAAKF